MTTNVRLRGRALALAGVLLATFFRSVDAAEPPAVRAVHNGEDGLWDKRGRRGLALDPTLVIGKAEQEEAYLLGRVFDIAVNSSGWIYVLDNGYGVVRQYDADGLFDRSIGNAGPGPGEFQFPMALTVDANDHLYVADRGKVCVFNGNGELLEEFRHGLPGALPRSIRTTSDASVLLSCFDVFEQKVIHRFDSRRAKVRSFCDSYAVGQEIDVRVEQNLSGGGLDVAENGTIYFTQRYPYEIRVFSPDDELQTVVYRDSDFLLPPVVVREDENITVGLPTSSYSIVALDDGNFINVVRKLEAPVATMLDLFSTQGDLLTSQRFDKEVSIRCKDAAGNLYSIETDEFPKVVRYAVTYGD